MKATTFTEASMLSTGIVVALLGVAWRSSAINRQVEFNTASIAESLSANQKTNEKLDQIIASLASTKTDIEVIKSKVQAYERPIYHTNSIADSLKRDVAMFKLGPAYARPFYQGPFGAR